MKIHAFQVEQDGTITIDAVLSHINELPLDKRVRVVHDVPLRLEKAQRSSKAWSLDFALLRHDGPGRGSLTDPIEDFDLEEDEGFGEETAAYFDGALGFLTVQYNHRGPRIGRIRGYLHQFARALAGVPEDDEESDEGFTLNAVLKTDAASRLNSMGIVKHVEVSFYVPGVLATPTKHRKSLSSFVSDPLLGSAGLVRIGVSAARGRGATLALNEVKRLVTDFLGVKEEVTGLSVQAKETEDAPSEPIDFLEARLVADVPVLVGAGRRYGRNERWAALKQSLDTWAKNGQLK